MAISDRSAKHELTAIIVKHGEWYTGYLPQIHGVNTQGRTLKEVRENLRDALELIMECNQESLSADIPEGEIIREPFAEITYRC